MADKPVTNAPDDDPDFGDPDVEKALHSTEADKMEQWEVYSSEGPFQGHAHSYSICADGQKHKCIALVFGDTDEEAAQRAAAIVASHSPTPALLPPCTVCGGNYVLFCLKCGLSATGETCPNCEAERKRRVEAEASVEQLGGDLKAAQLDYANERKRRVEAEAERDDAKRSREHTHDWYARHYGKLQDWARKRLPEPWQTEFFNCVANGTWGYDDIGTPYMSMVGKITPSGYFVMDDAYKQLLSDQTVRAEAAEANCRNLESALEEARLEARKEARMWEERTKEAEIERDNLADYAKRGYEGWDMYQNAWLREMGGVIRHKWHQIDGFVLRMQDIYEKAKLVDRIKQIMINEVERQGATKDTLFNEVFRYLAESGKDQVPTN